MELVDSEEMELVVLKELVIELVDSEEMKLVV